jgi:hypothetical protein
VTKEGWIAAIRSGLSLEGSQTSQSGGSGYLTLRNSIKRANERGHLAAFLAAFITVAEEGNDRDLEWWLSLLNLLEVCDFDKDARDLMKLVNYFENDLPVSIEVRAYIIRQLTYFRCKFDWERLNSQLSFKKVIEEYPLIVAASLVWSNKIGDANNILEDAKQKNKINKNDIRKFRDLFDDFGIKTVNTLNAINSDVSSISNQFLKEINSFRPTRYNGVYLHAA